MDKNKNNAIQDLFFRRLQTLADIWGKVFLFHHRPLEDKFPTEKLFFDAVKKLTYHSSREEFLEIVNDCLLKPLDDPITFAKSSQKTHEFSVENQILFGKIAPHLGYLQIAHPCILKKHSFFKTVYENIANMSGISSLIVDLRWESFEELGNHVVSAFFGLFTSLPLNLKYTCRTHYGWAESSEYYVYRQKKEVNDLRQITPIDKNESVA